MIKRKLGFVVANNGKTIKYRRTEPKDVSDNTNDFLIPLDILYTIFKEYVHPWGTDMVRLVCREWKDVADIFFLKYRESLFEESNARFLAFRSTRVITVSNDVQIADYTGEEVRYVLMMGSFFLDKPYKSAEEKLFYCMRNELSCYFIEFCAELPMKNYLDYAIEKGNLSSNFMEWLFKNVRVHIPLLLLYAFRRDDDVSLQHILDHIDKTYSQKRFEQCIPELLLTFAIKFSSIKCLETIEKHYKKNFKYISELENMELRAAVYQENVEMLPILSEKYSGFLHKKFFFKQLMFEATEKLLFRVIRWLNSKGINLIKPGCLLYKAITRGDYDMVKWMFESKQALVENGSIGKSPYFISKDSLTRTIMVGMNPKIFQLFESMDVTFQISEELFIWLTGNRFGHPGESHVRMIEYLYEHLPPDYDITDTLRKLELSLKTWIQREYKEEILWLKKKRLRWVDLDCTYNDSTMFNWYLDQLGENIQNHWHSQGNLYYNLGKAGKLPEIKRMYEEYGFKEFVFFVIPGAIVGKRKTPIEWIWKKRKNMTMTKREWIIWRIFGDFMGALPLRIIIQHHLLGFKPWFKLNVLGEHEVKLVTHKEMIELSEKETYWNKIVEINLNRTSRNAMDILMDFKSSSC